MNLTPAEALRRVADRLDCVDNIGIAGGSRWPYIKAYLEGGPHVFDAAACRELSADLLVLAAHLDAIEQGRDE